MSETFTLYAEKLDDGTYEITSTEIMERGWGDTLHQALMNWVEMAEFHLDEWQRDWQNETASQQQGEGAE